MFGCLILRRYMQLKMKILRQFRNLQKRLSRPDSQTVTHAMQNKAATQRQTCNAKTPRQFKRAGRNLKSKYAVSDIVVHFVMRTDLIIQFVP